MMKLFRPSGHLPNPVVELWQRGSSACAKAIPVFHGRRELITASPQYRPQWCNVGCIGCLWNQLVEPVGSADTFEMVTGRFSDGHVIQRIAHQSLCDRTRALDQFLDLNVDARTHPPCADIEFEGISRKGIQERQDHPPERTGRGLNLGHFDDSDRAMHLFETARIFPQRFQQATFEFQARRSCAASKLHRVQNGRFVLPPWRPQRQIWEKEIRGRGRVVVAEGLRQGAIYGQEAQGLVGLAAYEVFKIIADRGDSLPGGITQRRVVGSVPFLDGLQQPLQRLRKAGNAIEADDRQSAMRLMKMRARGLQVRRVGTFRAMPIKGLKGPLQGEVDFALDPSQGTDIQFGSCVHEMVPIRP